MIYIDQPVSTGYSPGNISVNDEHDVTTQFMGFWENFIDLFSMQGYNIYITGEDYAGQYIPYIASGFLDAKDKINFNLKGVLINDPFINYNDTLTQGKLLSLSLSVTLANNNSPCGSCPSVLPERDQPQRDIYGQHHRKSSVLRLYRFPRQIYDLISTTRTNPHCTEILCPRLRSIR